MRWEQRICDDTACAATGTDLERRSGESFEGGVDETNGRCTRCSGVATGYGTIFLCPQLLLVRSMSISRCSGSSSMPVSSFPANRYSRT